MNGLQSRIDAVSPLAYAICAALAGEIGKMGFPPGAVPIGDPLAAVYRLDRDPASGEHSLVGEWRDADSRRQGSLVFHADGTYFVEHDVIRPHPRDRRWFVEAVNAWGRDQDIRAEPRLLPVVA